MKNQNPIGKNSRFSYEIKVKRNSVYDNQESLFNYVEKHLDHNASKTRCPTNQTRIGFKRTRLIALLHKTNHM